MGLVIALAGCGALGSWIAMMIAGNTPIDEMWLFDDDAIEDGNLATTVYLEHQVGAQKTVALAEMLYRKGVDGIPISGEVKSHRDIFSHAPIPKDFIVVDTFDNREARMCTYPPSIEGRIWPLTLHAGVSIQRTGAVIWHQRWTPPPESEYGRNENPVCTRHLGAQILQLTAAHAASSIRSFAASGKAMDVPMILESGEVIR